MSLTYDWHNFDHILKLKVRVSKVYDVPTVLQNKYIITFTNINIYVSKTQLNNKTYVCFEKYFLETYNWTKHFIYLTDQNKHFAQ